MWFCSWQSWDNLATVSAQLGEWSTLIQAMTQVLDLTKAESCDMEPINCLLTFLESPIPPDTQSPAPAEDQPNKVGTLNPKP